MAALDEKGNYVYVSPAWQQYIGRCKSEVIGRNVLELLPDSKAMECLRTGQPIIVEKVVHNRVPAFTTYLPRFGKDRKVCGVFLYVVANGINDARSMVRQMNLLASEVDFYKDELARERGAKYSLDNIIGTSPAVQRMKEQIVLAAKSSSTVLIDGETGTGKELIAHSIHEMSARRTENFVRVNCAAIPPELMESEFFGYTPGAFTGALKKGKVGRFMLANRGSIFLDEVNLLTPTIQPKFLRVLQEMEVDPVGSEQPHSVDVRVIAASNIALEKLVQEGKFRSDLFYRLNVIRITAPPLRERKEDFPALTENLIQRLNRQLGMSVQGVSEEVLSMFGDYDWPGNVRELQNAIESAMNMAQSPILQVQDFSHLAQRISARRYQHPTVKEEFSLRTARQHFEAGIIRDALAYSNGNRVQAANLLGISRTVLYKKMEQYGLS